PAASGTAYLGHRWWLDSRTARPAPWSVFGAAPVQVGLDRDPRAAAEPHAIDLHVLHHALDVVACLRERNALDPVDGIDLGVARVAVFADPFAHAAAAGVVAGKAHDVGAAVILDEIAELGRAELHVVRHVAQ